MSSVPLPAPASLDSTPYEMEALRTLLAKVVENAPASRQKTFFSIGGRGHWENPASDVLAFFLNPDEQHGFGSLFLRVLFDCIGVDATGLDLDTSVQVRTEERLTSDERIDLVLRAPAWVLAIENKIYHWAANDFDAYASHVRRVADSRQQVYLALLAPERIEANQSWKPVTYRNFCKALQIAFDETFPKLPPSKWQMFAQEFAVHLQNLLYPVRMKLDSAQLALVEDHLTQIATLNRLSGAYTEFLVAELGARLARTLPDHPPCVFKVESWALVCDSTRGEKWRLVFLTPAHDHPGNSQRKFIAGVCLQRGASETLQQRARQSFAGTKNFYEGGEWWETFHEERESAVASLCEMARQLLGQNPVQSVG